jgi:membrane fusion protein
MTISTGISLLLAIAVAALLAFSSYTRRVNLAGVMLPRSGLVAVSVPANGWVQQLAVQEDDAVKEGALLYTLELDTTTKRGGVQQTIIDALTAQKGMLNDEITRRQSIAVETTNQLAGTITNLKAQLAQLAEQIKTQGVFEKILRDEYELYLKSFGNHNVSANEMDVRQHAWMAAESSLQQLQRENLRVQGELINAQYRAATNPIAVRNEIDALRAKISVIDQDLASSEAHRSIEIRAPGAGVVTAIAAHPGQVVEIGSRLLTIVPEHSSMVAQLLAPSSAVGFVHPGEHVLLRYSGFPYQKFGQYGGTVESVSRAVLREDEARQWQGRATFGQLGPYYLVTVSPDRQSVTTSVGQQPIPANMQVDAYVLLDSRPLYQWVFEPLYSIGRAWRNR